MSSLSRATVFRVSGLTKHENADSLSVGDFEGCPYIVNSNDTKNGDLRIFLPFDIKCPSLDWVPEFVRGQRIRPIRLRGVFSMAAVIPVPEGEFAEGEDVTERLGFVKYEPGITETKDGIVVDTKNGIQCRGPEGLQLPYYDIESLRKYHCEFFEGERVIIQEKIEGENLCVVYWQDQLHVRSRNNWYADGDNKWWNAVRKYDWSWLSKYPGIAVFAEKYGNVNKFRYDCANGEQRIRMFDMYDAVNRRFLPYGDMILKTVFGCTILYAPVLYDGPWLGLPEHKPLAEGKSTFGDNIREGFVVRPFENRFYGRHSERLIMKLHGESYMIAKGKVK